jgi:hypothetical protein
MDRLLFILFVSFGSLALGYLVQRAAANIESLPTKIIDRISIKLKLFAIVILQPVAIIYSFWTLTIQDSELFVLPLLGILTLLTGGASSLVQTKLFHIPASRAASLFVSGMFCNIGIFGGLIAFVLFGPLGFGIVQLFRVFEEIIYYAIGFPMSNMISKGTASQFRIRLSLIAERPIIFIPISAIIIGFLLNALPVSAPAVYGSISDIVVPVMTAILGFGIGMSLKVAKTRDYHKEIILVLITKYVIIPMVIIPLAYLFGMANIMDGVPFKVIIIVSFMPTAFMALVPPVLYGFDLDLANSAWLVTTLALLIVFPILFLIVT